jgi:hypothetical protein
MLPFGTGNKNIIIKGTKIKVILFLSKFSLLKKHWVIMVKNNKNPINPNSDKVVKYIL